MNVIRKYAVVKYLVNGIIDEITVSSLFLKSETDRTVQLVLNALARYDIAKMLLVPSISVKILTVKLDAFYDHQVL